MFKQSYLRKLWVMVLAVAVVFCFTIADAGAFAATKTAAPAYKAGDNFSITVKAAKRGNWKNDYVAKFTPTASGWYSFTFVKALKFTSDETGYYSLIVDADENPVSYGYALGEDSWQINIAGNLTAGKTYYLLVHSENAADYTTNVQLRTHQHNYVPVAQIKYDNFIDSDKINGTLCEFQGCAPSNAASYYNTRTFALKYSALTYTGTARTPSVISYDIRSLVVPFKDYTVTYNNNINVGTAMASINYNGIYLYKSYKIIPKGTTIRTLKRGNDKFTAKWYTQKVQTSGYQIQCATNSKFTKNKKTVTVKGNKTSYKTVRNLKNCRKYYVHMRTYKVVKGKYYYSKWSAVKKVTTR